jgi:hypothetical protein
VFIKRGKSSIIENCVHLNLRQRGDELVANSFNCVSEPRNGPTGSGAVPMGAGRGLSTSECKNSIRRRMEDSEGLRREDPYRCQWNPIRADLKSLNGSPQERVHRHLSLIRDIVQ